MFPDQSDVVNLLKITEEDLEMEERVSKIMEDQSGKSDKEYLDFIVNYQKGRAPGIQRPRKPKNEFCFFEMKEDEAEKLITILKKSEDLRLYFVKIGGLSMIKDSIDHNTLGLASIKLLLSDEKVREEF